jgi:hypothetical protein
VLTLRWIEAAAAANGAASMKLDNLMGAYAGGFREIDKMPLWRASSVSHILFNYMCSYQ